MTRCTIALIAMVFLAALPAVAHAQTLAQKQFMAKQDAEFAEAVPDTDKACGTALKASIDWPGFLKSEIGNNSIVSYCAEPLNTLRSMCSDPLAKTAISEKIKTYTCGFGGPGKRALSLDNGALHIDVDWDAANYGDYIKAWLGDHL
jgi:hypothetical protein